jgi:hypothetical protein
MWDSTNQAVAWALIRRLENDYSLLVNVEVRTTKAEVSPDKLKIGERRGEHL